MGREGHQCGRLDSEYMGGCGTSVSPPCGLWLSCHSMACLAFVFNLDELELGVKRLLT